MTRKVFLLAALAAALPALALARDGSQDAPPAASPGHPGYLADGKGCRVFDGSPAANEQVLWTGACADGFATGPGTLVWRVDGQVVETVRGALSAGKLDGAGVIIEQDGSSYAGDWKAGVKSGRGVQIEANGDTYEGDWADDRRDGQGTYKFAAGGGYEGTFRAGLPDGPGTLRGKDGGAVQGEWHEGCLIQGAAVYALNGDEARCRAASAAPRTAPSPGVSSKPVPPAPAAARPPRDIAAPKTPP